jgi:hypothetical protein
MTKEDDTSVGLCASKKWPKIHINREICAVKVQSRLQLPNLLLSFFSRTSSTKNRSNMSNFKVEQINESVMNLLGKNLFHCKDNNVLYW